jgi:two-component system NarL family sensor kinase
MAIILTATNCFAQNSFRDSMYRRIAIEKNDTEKVRLYVKLGNTLRQVDTLESQKCQKAILKIAEEKNNDYFKGQSYLLAGTNYLDKQPLVAIDNYEKALKLFAKYPNDLRSAVSMGTIYINLGLVHNNNADYNSAVDYYLKGEEVYLKHSPRNPDVGVIYSNISITYGTINKHSEALPYSKKGLDFARNGNDKVYLMNAYYAYGGNLINANLDSTGLLYLDAAKALATAMNNLFYIYSTDLMKGLYYFKTKQFQKAISYYTLCLDFALKYQSTPDMGNSYLNIAACLIPQKKTGLAAQYLDSAGKYLDLNDLTISKQEYFNNYAELYSQQGNHAKALAFKDSAAAIKDAIYQVENIKQTEFKRARYNYEAKQNEVERLEKEKKLQDLTLKERRNTMILLATALLAIIITSLLSYRNYRQKQKLQQQRISELETEKQLAATEAVLKGEEQERTRLAKDLHDGLGGMLSGIKYSLNTMKGNLVMTPDNAQAFERSMDMLDSSIKEMRRVAHNMMPEALVKFGLDTALKDFCNDINNSGALNVNYQSIGLENAVIDQTTSITIYRIVQELLNNTIKHASAKQAIVQVSKTGEQLSVTVEDDGKGFDTSILKGTKGIGWSNIQNRVEFLKGKLDVNSEPGKGTSVLIELLNT